MSSPKKEARPKTAPAAKSEAPKAGSTQPKPVKRPTTGNCFWKAKKNVFLFYWTYIFNILAGAKKPVSKKPGVGSAKTNSLAKSTSAKEVAEREMSPEEVDMKAEEILDPSILNGIHHKN